MLSHEAPPQPTTSIPSPSGIAPGASQMRQEEKPPGRGERTDLGGGEAWQGDGQGF